MSSAARAVAIGGLALPFILVVTVAALAVGVAPAPSAKPGPTPPPVAALPTDAPPSPSSSPSFTPSVGPSGSASAPPSLANVADPLAGQRRPPDGAPARIRLPARPPRQPDRRDDGRLRRSDDRPVRGVQRAARHRRLPVARPRELRAAGQWPVPVPAVTDEPRGCQHDGGLRARVRHRDRQLRLHRLPGRDRADQRRRRRRCPAAEVLLRPLLLGEQPYPRLGPAGRQEPPQRTAGADLRPQPEGRQRLRSCPSPADCS